MSSDQFEIAGGGLIGLDDEEVAALDAHSIRGKSDSTKLRTFFFVVLVKVAGFE